VVSFLLAFPPIAYMHYSSPNSCYISCPSHPPLLDHSNYTWRRVQVVKLLIMQFSPTFRHLISTDLPIGSLQIGLFLVMEWLSLWKKETVACVNIPMTSQLDRNAMVSEPRFKPGATEIQSKITNYWTTTIGIFTTFLYFLCTRYLLASIQTNQIRNLTCGYMMLETY
jgi:hypothetical protein